MICLVGAIAGVVHSLFISPKHRCIEMIRGIRYNRICWERDGISPNIQTLENGAPLSADPVIASQDPFNGSQGRLP